MWISTPLVLAVGPSANYGDSVGSWILFALVAIACVVYILHRKR